MEYLFSSGNSLSRWIQALVTLLLFWPIAIVVRKVVLFYFEKWTAGTENKYDDIIASRGHKHVLFWVILSGVYISSKIAPLGTEITGATDKLIFSLFIISLSIFVSDVISDAIKTYGSESKLSAPLTSLTENLIKIAVITMGGLVVLSHLGISITPLLTALGVGSLAVALALQDTLSNLFSGFYIIANKQTRTGDYIRLDSGQEGYVVDIGWRATRIRQLSNNMILIPNAKLGQAIVTNFHMPEKEMSMPVQVGVAYSSDLEKVEKVTLEVARETLRSVQGGVPGFEPSVRFHTFGDSAILFNVGLRVKDFSDQFLVTHEFIKKLNDRYTREGIEMPFPQRVVHLVNQEKK